jgi:hypothetical protein
VVTRTVYKCNIKQIELVTEIHLPINRKMIYNNIYIYSRMIYNIHNSMIHNKTHNIIGKEKLKF